MNKFKKFLYWAFDKDSIPLVGLKVFILFITITVMGYIIYDLIVNSIK